MSLLRLTRSSAFFRTNFTDCGFSVTGNSSGSSCRSILIHICTGDSARQAVSEVADLCAVSASSAGGSRTSQKRAGTRTEMLLSVITTSISAADCTPGRARTEAIRHQQHVKSAPGLAGSAPNARRMPGRQGCAPGSATSRCNLLTQSSSSRLRLYEGTWRIQTHMFSGLCRDRRASCRPCRCGVWCHFKREALLMQHQERSVSLWSV